MDTKEIIQELQTFKDEQKISDQTVEFVFSNQKYFFADTIQNDDKAIILIERKNYIPFSIESFENILNEFNEDKNIVLAIKDSPENFKEITNVFLSDHFLEIEAS